MPAMEPINDARPPAKVLDAILNDGITHAATIADIVADGDIAIVVYRLRPDAKRNARALGWDGTAPVCKMSEATRARMIASSNAIGGHVTARWLGAKNADRIFVVSGVGSLLVNIDNDGFLIEPGSTDERAKA